MKTRLLVALGLLLTVACSRLSEPVDLSGSEACALCRMAVSDVHFAAQIVARGEEPLFFDDIGCLANWLKGADVPQGAIAFVADHRTGHWALAEAAVYTKARDLSTPMGHGIIAHADAASRDQDAHARGGQPMTRIEVFGAGRLPGVPHAR